MTNWQPIIAAVAALIVAATPGVVALVQAFANRARIGQVLEGQHIDLTRVVDVLERLDSGSQVNSTRIDAVHRRLDQLGAPPASSSTSWSPSSKEGPPA